MVIRVRERVGDAIQRLKMETGWSLTKFAAKSVGEFPERVTTSAPNHATWERTVVLASSPAKSAVNIPGVYCAATRPALRVSNDARGRASTEDLVLCPVLLLATDYRAISGVPRHFLVVTSAPGYVGRGARRSIATNVP